MAAVTSTSRRTPPDERFAIDSSSTSERNDPRDALAARQPDRNAHGRSAALLGWVIRHSEPTFADGLRYIHQAERIELRRLARRPVRWRRPPASPSGNRRDASSDRRRRPGLVATRGTRALLHLRHRSWSFPSICSALELFGEQAAWLACLLVTVNPVVDDIVVNVLSESTFLLWWTFGLWCAVRFLRDGRFLWLPPAIGLGALAYLTRPEGMLLPAALAATLLISPLFRATRIEWPRWWCALAFHGGGPGDHGRALRRAQGGSWYQAGNRSRPRAWRPGAAAGPGARQTGPARSVDLPDLPPGDDPHDQGISRRRDRAVVPVRALRAGPGGAAAGPRQGRALPGDRPGRVGARAGAAARDRRVLHGPARAHPRHASDTGRCSFDHMANEQDLDPRPLARPDARTRCDRADLPGPPWSGPS